MKEFGELPCMVIQQNNDFFEELTRKGRRESQYEEKKEREKEKNLCFSIACCPITNIFYNFFRKYNFRES